MYLLMGCRFRKNEGFTKSNGWLNKCKTRYDKRLVKISREEQSSQSDLVNAFKETSRSAIERIDLTSLYIYNEDEIDS